MSPLLILASLLLPSILAIPLSPAPAQLLNSFPLLSSPLSSAPNTTLLTSSIGCFMQQRKTPPFIPTTKPICELALDNWVRGQSLIQPRTFTRTPTSPDDVMLPLQRVSGTCMIYVSTEGERDEDVLTLAELYAEVLGPDGVLKQCLGQVRMPAIGGRMAVGSKGVVKVAVTGVEGAGGS